MSVLCSFSHRNDIYTILKTIKEIYNKVSYLYVIYVKKCVNDDLYMPSYIFFVYYCSWKYVISSINN